MEDNLNRLVPPRPVVKNSPSLSPRELELNRLRLKYVNDTQTDPRLQGEKPWVAYFVSLIETAVDNGGDLPYFSKPSPFSWSLNITSTDRELFPIELSNASMVTIFFDPDLEVFFAELFV